MRWIWIDKFTAFEPGRRAVAVKNVTMAEEVVHDLYPAFPIFPSSLIIEGMAQTAGILVGHARNFSEKVILAKIGRATFHRLVRPGDTIVHEAVIQQLTDAGASAVGTVRLAGDDTPGGLVAEIELMFSHIDKNMGGLRFPEHNFVFTEQFTELLKTYQLGGAVQIERSAYTDRGKRVPHGMKRVVVTGIGVTTPLGIGAEAFWSALLAGKCGIRANTVFDQSGFGCRWAGVVPEYRIGDFVPKSYRKATKLMARDIELAVIAADHAVRDAGLKTRASETPQIDGMRFGCNIGAGLINAELNELTAAMDAGRSEENPNKLDLKRWGREGLGQLTPLWLLKYLPNMLACHVTIIHGLCGPSNTITCADASSHLAIGEAFRTIQRGKADLAICGGGESKINPMGIVRQILLHRLNDEPDTTPEQAVRPFDAAAKGTVYGEGAGLLILEELEHARKRDAKIYAELVGFAASQDTYRVSEPDPSGHSYGQAVKNAIRDAGLKAGDVGLIVPHGLGIASADEAELRGFESALGDHLPRVAMSPIKPAIGNLAAGCGVDAAAAVLALHTRKAPPAPNTRKILGGRKLNVAAQARDLAGEVALSSVYSLGGQNAALVFRRMGN